MSKLLYFLILRISKIVSYFELVTGFGIAFGPTMGDIFSFYLKDYLFLGVCLLYLVYWIPLLHFLPDDTGVNQDEAEEAIDFVTYWKDPKFFVINFGLISCLCA